MKKQLATFKAMNSQLLLLCITKQSVAELKRFRQWIDWAIRWKEERMGTKNQLVQIRESH